MVKIIVADCALALSPTSGLLGRIAIQYSPKTLLNQKDIMINSIKAIQRSRRARSNILLISWGHP